MNAVKSLEENLALYLKKCELQYRVDHTEGAFALEWLKPHTKSVEDIAVFLRQLGFRIKEIVDYASSEEMLCWVETTSGVIVYQDNFEVQGLAAKAARCL